jgi:hypothetical protein
MYLLGCYKKTERENYQPRLRGQILKAPMS